MKARSTIVRGNRLLLGALLSVGVANLVAQLLERPRGGNEDNSGRNSTLFPPQVLLFYPLCFPQRRCLARPSPGPLHPQSQLHPPAAPLGARYWLPQLVVHPKCTLVQFPCPLCHCRFRGLPLRDLELANWEPTPLGPITNCRLPCKHHVLVRLLPDNALIGQCTTFTIAKRLLGIGVGSSAASESFGRSTRVSCMCAREGLHPHALRHGDG